MDCYELLWSAVECYGAMELWSYGELRRDVWSATVAPCGVGPEDNGEYVLRRHGATSRELAVLCSVSRPESRAKSLNRPGLFRGP